MGLLQLQVYRQHAALVRLVWRVSCRCWLVTWLGLVGRISHRSWFVMFEERHETCCEIWIIELARPVHFAVTSCKELRIGLQSNDIPDWISTMSGLMLNQDDVDIGLLKVGTMLQGDILYLPPQSLVVSKVCSEAAMFLRVQTLAVDSRSTSKEPWLALPIIIVNFNCTGPRVEEGVFSNLAALAFHLEYLGALCSTEVIAKQLMDAQSQAIWNELLTRSRKAKDDDDESVSESEVEKEDEESAQALGRTVNRRTRHFSTLCKHCVCFQVFWRGGPLPRGEARRSANCWESTSELGGRVMIGAQLYCLSWFVLGPMVMAQAAPAVVAAVAEGEPEGREKASSLKRNAEDTGTGTG